jgi:DNA-binding transcriptional MerR regulator/methylmalonyl-CoA mutase cobalamin-binding subunit
MENQKYPIKIVADRTGLSMHVIRAWEKRYGVVKPSRTETNRRLYSSQDILKLQLLKHAVKAGHQIGSIANLEVESLKELIEEDRSYQIERISIDEHQEKYNSVDFINRFVDQIDLLDAKGLDEILQQASISMSKPKLIDDVLVPIIELIGERWRDGSIRVYHEHSATAVLRSFLSNIRTSFEPDLKAPGIVVTTPKGQVHELGAMLVAATAAIEGWKVTYLGPDLPVDEIAAASQLVNAKLVCLSIVYPIGDPSIVNNLEQLNKFLPQHISLLIGGRAAYSYKNTIEKINATILRDMPELREYLRSAENKLLSDSGL